MSQARPGRAAVPRRAILRSLALAPAALAGCAGAGAAAHPPGAAPDGGSSAAARSPDAAVAALRAVPLPPAAEPAFVFRAALARPGEGK